MLPFLQSGFNFIPDELPDAFSFTDLTGKNAATQYSSNIVQINGLNIPVTCTITGGSGQLQVSSDSLGASVVHSWASSVTIEDGQYLQARLTTGGWDGTTTGHIIVGQGSTNWHVTTNSVTSSTTNYSGVGGHSVLIPTYSFITIKIWGAGGGGGGVYDFVEFNNIFGDTGTVSTWAGPSTLTANPGTGGGNGRANNSSGANGSPGTASGGDFNTTGGGNSGGSGGTVNDFNHTTGGRGGNGGFVQKTWAFGDSGAPVIGNTYTLTLGQGGAADPGNYGDLNSTAGANATAQISIS